LSTLWTIEELAAATEMTVRNVRAHQSRGLLPPPKVRGRVGYYGQDHLERLRTIRQMQEEGFNLSAIRSLLAAGDETAERLRRLRAPVLDEHDVGPLAELSTDSVDTLRNHRLSDFDALLVAGVIRRLPTGGYAAASPAMLVSGRRLAALGLGATRQIAALNALVSLAQEAAGSLATVATQLCGDECTDPEVLDEARTWITEVVRAVLDRRITVHFAETYGDTVSTD
jgi:DNA-binding transcriptional MerR regulator